MLPSDTVVQVLVIVPPSCTIDVLYRWNNSFEDVSRLLETLQNEQHQNHHAQAHLKRICELILTQTPSTYNKRYCVIPDTDPRLQEIYQNVGAIALQLGNFDLFDEATQKTSGSLFPVGYKQLGRTVVQQHDIQYMIACVKLGTLFGERN